VTGESVNHQTYVASKCPRCRADVLRICISHDNCEFDHHNETECRRTLNDLLIETSHALALVERLAPKFGTDDLSILQARIALENAYNNLQGSYASQPETTIWPTND
jgi:hypothetical protein